MLTSRRAASSHNIRVFDLLHMSLLLNTESDKDEAAILKDSGVNAIGRGIKGSGIYPLIKYPKY